MEPMRRIHFKGRYMLIVCLLAVLAAAVFGFLKWRDAAGFGVAKAIRISPQQGRPYAAAISPDGSQTAAIYRASFAGGSVTDGIEIRDVATGRDAGSFLLPPMKATAGKRQFSVAHPIRYCDSGKYLLAYTFPDMLFIVDAHTSQVHGSIALSDLQARIYFTPETRHFPDSQLLSQVQLDCSAAGNKAILGAWGDGGTLSLKLFDLDTVTEVRDLAGTFDYKSRERYLGDGLAISPDGSRIAIVNWKSEPRHSGATADVVDTESGAILRSTYLGHELMEEHQLAFAGESALLIGAPECRPNGRCNMGGTPKPSGRTLQVWEFEGTGAVHTLGWPHTETYRSFGASTDGARIFSYSGAETYCKSCNGKAGELKIANPWFTVWDRNSTKVLARSPYLPVVSHNCPWFHLGACEDFQQVPTLEFSSNGKAVLAFWRPGFDPPPEKGEEADPIAVYRLP